MNAYGNFLTIFIPAQKNCERSASECFSSISSADDLGSCSFQWNFPARLYSLSRIALREIVESDLTPHGESGMGLAARWEGLYLAVLSLNLALDRDTQIGNQGTEQGSSLRALNVRP